jgi:quinol monooxygenase YgiN
MITVIARYRTRPEAVGEVRELLARHSRESEAEPKCLRFLAHQDAEDPTCFALYEVYEDPAAFHAHRESKHFRANVEKTLVPLLLEREWRVYGPPLTTRM